MYVWTTGCIQALWLTPQSFNCTRTVQWRFLVQKFQNSRRRHIQNAHAIRHLTCSGLSSHLLYIVSMLNACDPDTFNDKHFLSAHKRWNKNTNQLKVPMDPPFLTSNIFLAGSKMYTRSLLMKMSHTMNSVNISKQYQMMRIGEACYVS